jgi:hypothetical protein
MKVLFLDEELIFKVVPRKYPSVNDEFLLTFRNESTGVTFTPSYTFDITDKLEITLPTQPNDFALQNKYDIEIKLDSEIIYLGKAIVLESGTNIQNYNYGSQSNSRFKFKA